MLTVNFSDHMGHLCLPVMLFSDFYNSYNFSIGNNRKPEVPSLKMLYKYPGKLLTMIFSFTLSVTIIEIS